MNKVFGLFSGEYSDWNCHGYYTDPDEAERAAIALSQIEPEYGWQESYYVVPLVCLEGKNELYKGELIYNYEVIWSRHCGDRTVEFMSSEPRIERRVLHEEGTFIKYERKVSEYLEKKIKEHPLWPDFLNCKWSNSRYLSDEECIKIAYDMVAEWKAEQSLL